MMAEPVLEEGIPVEEDLQPCRICGRTFLPTPLVKHVKICEKNAAKKRKVFNSLRQRVEGTDLALFHQKSYLKKNQNQESPAAANPTAQPSSPVAPTTGAGGAGNKSGRAEGAGGGCSKPTWKEKHDQLVESIRAARSADNVKGTGSTSGQQPVGRVRSSATMLNSSFERCPCCDRQFGPKAYDRHVEWCKEKMSRLPASSMPTNQEAKDRLEARTKYRVPPMNKNKKTVKEKYQPSSTAAPASNSQMPGIPNVRSTGNLDRKSNFQRSSSVRRTPSMTNQESPSTRMAEVKAKNAVMGRRTEPIKGNITTNTTNNNNTNATTSDKTDATYNPFITAERQLMELLECEDFKPYNHNPTLTNNNNKKNNSITNNNNTNVKKSSAMSPTPKLKSISPPLGKHPKAATAMKRQSVIDPPSDFKDRGKESNVDARDDIDFEMLENFINDNFGNDELMRKLDLDTISLASCSTKTDNNASSFYDDISIDPRLINDFDNLSIPDNLDTDTTTTPDMLHQYPLAHSNRFRLEPLESAQQARNRKASTSSVSSYGDAAMPTHRGDESAKKKSLASLKRAVAITDPVKASKNLRSRDDVENYFNECDKAEAKDTRDARLEFELVSATCAGEELFSVDDEMYEEYKKYEQMYLKEREEQLRREAEMRNNEDSAGHLISGDSAYGSLNRSGKAKVRSKVTKLSPMEPARVDSASSSGSDTCVMQNAPPHPTPMKTSSSSNENNSTSTGKTSNNNSSKLSKFCHECGNRYPLTTAKFCVECGVRRLAAEN